MSDIDKIIYTSVSTIIGGVAILIFGQIVIKFLIEPYQEYRKLLAEIVDDLTFYANVHANMMTKEALDDANRAIRQKASRLRATTYTLPMYWLYWLLQLVPSRKDVDLAAGNLIGISNLLYRNEPRAHIERLEATKQCAKRLRLRNIAG